jgi:hypothetical protein
MSEEAAQPPSFRYGVKLPYIRRMHSFSCVIQMRGV